MCDSLHPFESAGLGKAPFRYVGMEHKVGPVMMADGITQIGAPGQPMGTCDYCLNGIAFCFRIRSADGKEFTVGCDCVEKLYKDSNATASKLASDAVYQKIKRDKAAHDRKVRLAREAKRIAEGQQWAEANRTMLESIPTGKREGETLWNRYEWFMANAGNKGKQAIIKELQKAVTDKQTRRAYCENESIYGSTCGDEDCPHCFGIAGGNLYFQ